MWFYIRFYDVMMYDDISLISHYIIYNNDYIYFYNKYFIFARK